MLIACMIVLFLRWASIHFFTFYHTVKVDNTADKIGFQAFILIIISG